MPTPLEHAIRFTEERRWKLVPVPHGAKRPILQEWQNLRLTVEDLPTYFNGQPQNIGVLLGAPSGHLLDVDLDCREAVMLAQTFLPPTDCKFGRPSKRASHWFYVGSTPTDGRQSFEDPERVDGRKRTCVELRSTRFQTILPGSLHGESGEEVTWDDDGELASVDPADLEKRVKYLAVASLLARHWPTEGTRHDAAM